MGSQTLDLSIGAVTSRDLTQTEINEQSAMRAQAVKDHLSAYRYQKENGGITVSATPVQTDRNSRPDLIGARINAKEDADYTVNWKTPTGFVELNATQIIAIADAVSAHVQKCFAAEAAIKAAVEDGTHDTKAKVEAAFDAAYADA